ncbi:unnamed protein product [Closterium sp. NIES-64]|nr:unnamed protein product [Closterium sp. NIES-64]
MRGLTPSPLAGSVWRFARAPKPTAPWPRLLVRQGPVCTPSPLRHALPLCLPSYTRLLTYLPSVSVAGCRTTLSCGTTALVTPPYLACVACTLASLSLVYPGLCLPSLPRLRRPAFLASRGGSAPLLTPPRSLPQRLPCRLSTWKCGAQPASVDRATSGIRAARLQLRERFQSEFPVLRLHSDRGGEFSSNLLAAFCAEHGIRQTFMLPASPQQNGVAQCRIGLVMEVVRTSMIHAAAPHFLWPFAVRYAAHQLNLWPRVSLPETSPTLLWTGKVGDASRFRVWGARAFVRDTTADKLSPRAIPCVFLGFVPDAPGWQFYDPASRRVFASQDVTFDESVPFYRLFPYRTAPRPLPPLFLAPGPPQVDPLPAPGPAPSGVSQVEPPVPAPVAVTGDSGSAGSGAVPGGAELQGAQHGGAESGGAEREEPEGAEPGGAEPAREDPGGPEPGGAASGGTAPPCVEPGGARSGELGVVMVLCLLEVMVSLVPEVLVLGVLELLGRAVVCLRVLLLVALRLETLGLGCRF